MAFLLEEMNLGRGKRKEVRDPGWETCVMGSLARMYQTTLLRSPSRVLSLIPQQFYQVGTSIAPI